MRTAAVSSTSASAIRLVREPEAVAVDGLDQGGVAQLAPQRRQVHVEHLGGPVPVLVPGPLDDLLPADQPARVGDQALQDRELLRGQRHVGAGHRYPPGPQVDGERPVPQHLAPGRLLPLPATQHRPDPGQQLGQAERLDQVIVGALVEREHPVGLLAAGRHHDDRGVRVGPEAAADVNAV
jgi:hypothetical protein